MTDPSPPPDAGEIMAVVHEAVGGIELEPAEKREIWRFTGGTRRMPRPLRSGRKPTTAYTNHATMVV